MLNTLYLPELREMLAGNQAEEMSEFCSALHPARTAEFMEGLDPSEAWAVLRHAPPDVQEAVFGFFNYDKQIAIIEHEDRREIAQLIANIAADDRVDLLEEVDEQVVSDLLPLLPPAERRDVLRLRAYPEGTAGAIMTTEAAKLSETLSVREALQELSQQAENLETIYYLYVVDDQQHLRGVVSARQLISALGKPNIRLGDLMEANFEACHVLDDQEQVAAKVARFDLLAIPVVDNERRMLGIITHDDVIDVMREEATEDAHRISAVDPLEASYLRTSVVTLGWKRGIWLTILFFAALLTAFALKRYQGGLLKTEWLMLFIPLVISCGGNTGSQSATLIITGLATGDVKVSDWSRVIWRELMTGMLLGTFLGFIGFLAAVIFAPAVDALVIPLTLLLVVISGTMTGALLPLVFKHMGLDPALMSNPFVSVIIDILGIFIYMNIALMLL